jgi:hypothetical protein
MSQEQPALAHQQRLRQSRHLLAVVHSPSQKQHLSALQQRLKQKQHLLTLMLAGCVQVAQVFGYQLAVFVDAEQEQLAEGEQQQQLQQPLPLAALQVNLTAAGARLSGGRARAAGGGGGSGGLLPPAGRVSLLCVVRSQGVVVEVTVGDGG